MSNWILLSERKPKGGERFIGCGYDKRNRIEWNLFTAPNHDQKDDQGRVEMTKEQHLDKIIDVYQLFKWMVPDVNTN